MCPLTPEAVSDQQHFAVLPATDLFDNVEVLLDLQVAEALSRELHQLVDQAPVWHPQLNHRPWNSHENSRMHVTWIYIVSQALDILEDQIYIHVYEVGFNVYQSQYIYLFIKKHDTIYI